MKLGKQIRYCKIRKVKHNLETCFDVDTPYFENYYSKCLGIEFFIILDLHDGLVDHLENFKVLCCYPIENNLKAICKKNKIKLL